MGRRKKNPAISEEKKKSIEEKFSKIDFGDNQIKKTIARLMLDIIYTNVSQTRTQLKKKLYETFIGHMTQQASTNCDELINLLVVEGCLKDIPEEVRINVIQLQE